MKQVTINTSIAGCDWIYSSLFDKLKTHVFELGSAAIFARQNRLDVIIEIAETIRVVCEARENAKKG